MSVSNRRRMVVCASESKRADKLVQLIAKQKGLSHPVIDATVALVDARLESNRKAAA